MRKIVLLLSWLLFMVALGACSASSAVTKIPSITQSIVTETIRPTSTVSIVSTIDLMTPTVIAQPIQTQEVLTVTPESTYTPSYEDCSLGWSVRGSWALCDTFADPITIINTSNKMWQFSYRSHYGKEILNPCTRLNYITNDERYLYFSLVSECVMTEPGFDFSIGVFRWNLINGEVNEILKASYDFASDDGSYYSVSISPTGRRMAYIYPQKSPLFLTIHDLQTGENRTFSLEEKYRYGGRFEWSDDGTKLVFMLESNSNDEYFISMVYIDLLKDNSIATFIKDKDPSWISAHLEVMDKGINVFPVGDTALQYDIETGNLSPIPQ